MPFKHSDRTPPDKIALAEGGTVLLETRSIGISPSASAILSGGARSLMPFKPARMNKEAFS